MARLTKQHSSTLIRSAKPTVQPDREFVLNLQTQLQDRAQVMAKHPHQQTKPSWWQRWTLLTSMMSVGAVAVVAAVMVVPSWLNPTSPISGYIQKGPFISGTAITIQELDDQLQPTGTSYQVTTASDFGDYRLSQELHSDYVEVIAQGFYYDEVRGELSSAPLTLRALATVNEDQTVNVNVLTTLAAPRIRHIVNVDDLSFTDAKNIAEQEVLSIFKITGSDGTDFEHMNISAAGTNNGILLAVSALLQGNQSVAELSELLSKLSLAIKTDGTVEADGTLLTIIRSNANTLNSYQITTNLQARFTALGVNAQVPEFSDWLKPFLDTADPLAYRLTLPNQTFGVDPTKDATIKVTITGEDFVVGEEEASLKETVTALTTTVLDTDTIVAEFPISKLSAGSYTVTVRNTVTDRIGVTDGLPLEESSADPAHTRLILRGYAPVIKKITSDVSYLKGGTITVTGEHFAYGTFVWINDWQVPQQAIRIANDQRIDIDLSPALIANNEALPRKTDLTLTIQTPDFQTTEQSGFQIQ